MYDKSKKAANAAAGRAASVQGEITKLKDTRAGYTKNMRAFDKDPLGNLNLMGDMPNDYGRRKRLDNAKKAQSGINDRSKTLTRLENRKDRNERSAKYRAKAAAVAKMKKGK